MSAESANLSKPSGATVWTAFAVLLFGWVTILATFPRVLFKESDIYWMLETGRYMFRHAALPSLDSYSFATLQTPWIVYQWLTEVLFSVSAFLGFYGVACLGEVTLALLLCVQVFRRAIKIGANSIIAFFVVAIATFATFPDIGTLRPQLFSFIFLFALQSIFEDLWSETVDRRQFIRMLIKTLVIGVLWANCHISFPLGFALAAVYVGCAAAGLILHKDKDKTNEQTRLSRYGWITATFAAATLVNPYSIGLWLFLETISKVYVTPEMAPLTDLKHLLIFSAILLTALYSWRRAGIPRVIWAISLFVAGVLHTRFCIYFCVCVCPLLAQSVTEMLPNLTGLKLVSRFSEGVKQAASKKIYPLAIVVVSLAIICCQPLYVPVAVPMRASEYFNEHPIAGNLFASIHASNYLIYRYDGALKVFVDTRFDLYDPALVSRYFAALQGQNWKDLFAEYKIQEALLPYGLPLTDIVAHDPDWTKVYEDPYFSIFVRK